MAESQPLSPEALVPTRYVKPCAIWSSENQNGVRSEILEQTREICHGLLAEPVLCRIFLAAIVY